MRILVTGAAGFVGTHLVGRLLKEGHHVVGIDNFYSSSRNKLKVLERQSSFRFVEHDVIQPIEIREPVDQVYHLACPASPPRYQKNGLYTLKVNFMGTLNICEFALRSKAKMLFTSTSEVYGDPAEHPQRESYRGNVNTYGIRACYDEGKRVAESVCFEYQKDKGLKCSIVRIFNTYGPYMDLDDGRVVTNFITQALEGKPLTVFGDGSQSRSLCYVSDMVGGIIKAMNTDLTGPINLGNPTEHTVLELAQIIKELTNSRSTIAFKSLPADDPTRRKPDITLAKERLGWAPSVGLEAGLLETIAWVRRQSK